MRPNAKPCHTSKTATASTPEGELQKHLKDLGLASVEAYRMWCKASGFSVNVNKNWQERRQEKQTAEKQAQHQAATDALLPHLESLGLRDMAAYEAWCRERHFPTGLKKSKAQLENEQQTAQRERAQIALTHARRPQRRPEEVFAALHDRTARVADLKSPPLQAVAAAFAVCSEQAARDALLSLLLHAHRQTKLLSGESVITHFGDEWGNSYPAALAALALHCKHWQRDARDWKPDSHNARRQFGGLARHLLADYAVPAFLDAVWFRGVTDEARRQQGWFLHIGQGQNIRTADVPIALTKRAAHLFMQAPGDMSVEAALRWAQIIALGGDEYLVRAILSTRLGTNFEHEEFWLSVLHFFVNNPMLDADCIGPMIDFIHNQRFVEQDIVVEGEVVQGIPEPDFTMKGRTVPALQQRVEAWHLHLAKQAKRPVREWEPCGLQGWSHVERDEGTGVKQQWTVTELLTSVQLQAEGKAMHHCVASYTSSCARGQISIWSLQAQYLNGSSARRVMTIEVDNKQRAIVQARGNCNKTPGLRHVSGYLNDAPDMVRAWAAQEGLKVSKHLWLNR